MSFRLFIFRLSSTAPSTTFNTTTTKGNARKTFLYNDLNTNTNNWTLNVKYILATFLLDPFLTLHQFEIIKGAATTHLSGRHSTELDESYTKISSSFQQTYLTENVDIANSADADI